MLMLRRGRDANGETRYRNLFCDTVDWNYICCFAPFLFRNNIDTGAENNAVVVWDEETQMRFQVTPVYGDGNPKRDFYYGTYQEIEHKILAERIDRLVLSGMIALVGSVMLVYGLFVVKKGQDAETIMKIYSRIQAASISFLFDFYVSF